MMAGTIEISLDGHIGDLHLNVDMSLPMRGISALFGRSGCGKTSILRSVAGLSRIPGQIAVGNEAWQREGHFVPTHKRSLGYVFQEASLFAHLNVRQNLNYGHRRAGKGSGKVQFDDVVELLGLVRLLDRSPENLSGGERQRVALGRALLSQPRLLLMDEPLSALDRLSRDEILPYFEALHASLKIPILLVTHDLDEVERLADHLVLLQSGKVLASGPLHALQGDPSLPLAARRDAGVTLDAAVTGYDHTYGLATLTTNGATLTVPLPAGAAAGRHRLTVRAGDVSLAREVPHATTVLNVLPAKILSASHSGYEVIALLGLGSEGAGSRILARVTKRSWDQLQLQVGMGVHAQIKSVALVREAKG